MRIVLVAALALAPLGCAIDNPFDPDAPADLQQKAKVAGTVKDAAGPVKEATVSIGDVTFTTGDDGKYGLSGVAPGIVTLTVEHAGHVKFERDVALEPGSSRTVDVELVPLGADSGHIKGVARKAAAIAADDPDDDVDPDFSGIVVETGDGVRTVTNAHGDFDLFVLPGTYTLTLSAPDHVAQVVPDVEVVDGTPADLGTLTLAAQPGSISGHAFLTALVPGQETHGGVLVTVGSATAVTADDDAFQVTGLASGPAVVKFTRDGYEQLLVPVVVTAGVLSDIGDVTLARATGSAHGTVSLDDTADASGVTITLSGAAGRFATSSAVDGTFALASVPTGTYDVDASKNGYASASGVVEIVAGGDVAIDALALTAATAAVTINDGAALTNDPDVTVRIDVTGLAAPARVHLSEDPTFAAGTSDVAFSASGVPFTLSDGDGEKTVFLELLDANGAVIGRFNASIELDATPPVLGGAPVLVNFDEPFTSSVSVTVTFDVEGASQVAFAVDGVVDTESLQPFAQFFTVLLPATECTQADPDCASVCAVFSDDAGNRTAPVCDVISVDTTAPAAPLIVETSSVVPTLAEGDDSVPFTLHLLDRSVDEFFDHYEVLLDAGDAAPAGATSGVFVPVTPGAPSGGQLPVALTLFAVNTGDASLDAQPNLVRVRAVDQAGNVSPESAITVVVDSKAPDAPVLAGAPAATNADTVSVNFRPDQNTADDDATFDHYRVSTTLLPQPFDSFQRDGIVVELLPDVTNTITVSAVDAAGNVSAPSSPLVIKHDDVAPGAPTISPTEGTARGTTVEIGLVVPSLDSPAQDQPQGTPPAQVNRYQLKDGLGEGFKDVGPGPGPFLAVLRPNRDNDICLRGVDDAGNVGIEECALVHEVTKRTIAGTVDHPHGSDVFGDVMVFGGFQGKILLRDLAGLADDVVLAGGNPPIDGLAQAGQDADFHLGGDGRRVFAVWEGGNDFGNTVSLVFKLDFTSGVDANNHPQITRGVFFGRKPSVDGSAVAYVNQLGQVAVHDVNTFTYQAPGSNTLPAAGDNGTALTGAVALCSGTEPRIAAGVVVWCQEPNHKLMRSVLSFPLTNPQPAPVQLAQNIAAVREGALVGSGGGGIQQPVVSAEMIAWSSADAAGIGTGTFFIDISADPSATAPVKAGNLALDDIEDADGFTITSIQVSGDGLTNDVGAFVLALNPFALGATNDPSPQADTAVDGTRAVFKDTTNGETMELIDSSTLRWVNGGATTLVFEPVTSSQATAWIQGVDQRIALVAREVPFDNQPIVVLDDPANQFFFAGPAHADPPFAVGGTRVAFATTSGKLIVKDIASGQSAVSSVNAALPPVLALDPDGDELVFVDSGGAVRRVALPATLPATLSPSTQALAGAGAVTFLDLDDDMLVAQRGGNPDRESDSSGTGALVCAKAGVTAVVAAGGFRGPKVAHLASGQFLAAATDGDHARGCFLTCSATPSCSVFTANAVGRDTHAAVSRSGSIGMLNDLTGLAQIIVFDVFSRRSTHVTTGDFERSALTMADTRITWADASLDGFAVFETDAR